MTEGPPAVVGGKAATLLELRRAGFPVPSFVCSPSDLAGAVRALGLPLAEVYGQTESTGIMSAMREGRARPGTVGEPIAGIEVRLADDGEILTRGPHVFQGYFKDA